MAVAPHMGQAGQDSKLRSGNTSQAMRSSALTMTAAAAAAAAPPTSCGECTAVSLSMCVAVRLSVTRCGSWPTPASLPEGGGQVNRHE
jgi:hypothetical protein